MKLNPYLSLPGTGNDALEFYKKVFNVEPNFVQKFKDMPPTEGFEVSPQAGERILHASFPIGNDMFMISDMPEHMDAAASAGNQTNISIHPDSKEEADRIFAMLSDGGKVTMPLAMQFWGDYYGACQDKYGVSWMVNYHEQK